MNLAGYLSELLGQHDEVSVPGLGYFERVRVNGYYNEEEVKFYPPCHQVKFVPELKDDDTFAQYVADKKNISLASSKYFTEKFISTLREQAGAGDYTLANLGSFYTENEQLVFKPREKIEPDPSFFGYSPVVIRKQGYPQSAVLAEDIPMQTSPAGEIAAPPQEYIEDAPQEDVEQEPVRNRPVNVWLIFLIILTVLALAVFGVFRFYPDAIDKLKSPDHKIINKKPALIPVVKPKVQVDTAKKMDTARQTAAVTDTTKKTATAAAAPSLTPADTGAQASFEIVVDAFRTQSTADELVQHYKTMGLDAKILPHLPRRLLRVSVGSYHTYREAEDERRVLVKAKKIRKDSQTIEINSKK